MKNKLLIKSVIAMALLIGILGLFSFQLGNFLSDENGNELLIGAISSLILFGLVISVSWIKDFIFRLRLSKYGSHFRIFTTKNKTFIGTDVSYYFTFILLKDGDISYRIPLKYIKYVEIYSEYGFKTVSPMEFIRTIQK